MKEVENHTDALISFSLTAQIDQMKKEESWEKHGRSSKTLHKANSLRLVLNTMKAGTEIKTHHAKGPISVHCIEGKMKFNTEEKSVILQKGELLTLQEFVQHSVEAVEETSFLLTLAPLETSRSNE